MTSPAMTERPSSDTGLLLDGKVALVTGGGRGIGLATARLFAAHGAAVYITGHTDPAALTAQAEALAKAYDVPVTPCVYDATDRDAMQGTFQRIFKDHHRLDVLVNNAGVLHEGLLGMIRHDDMQQVLAVNTMAAIEHMQAASRLMARNKAGSIINLSSIVGRVGSAGNTLYAASKAAIIGATLSAAKELAVSNIRVNAVAPGFITTDMTDALPEQTRHAALDSIAMGRPGTADDVARVNLFLASPLSAYVTGQTIGVDGGMLI